MVKQLVLFREGTLSVTQLRHIEDDFVHILTKPTRHGLLYYIGRRPNRRTKKFTIIAGGFRTLNRAMREMIRYIGVERKRTNSDPMTRRVYAWEEIAITPHYAKDRLDPDHIRNLVYRVCGDFQVPPPELMFVKRLGFCYFATCENNKPFLVFSLEAEFRNAAVVLHELAHYLADLSSKGIDNHGPIFLREYLRLLLRYGNFDLNSLRDSLTEAKVKYYLPK